ncbi:YEATS domain-containing protein 4 [Drosophila eugracilis]|uniref:YEATS domain-containing protein 4 n=1 Tax=Drosophila eugracilis TaxID=29029 RepID=UPI0007E828FE|nr:YEATS domain-containing protein 4 [Drosophila eugracilis]
MSYTNLLRQQNVVDDCQRVSCNRGPVNNLSGRCVISRDIVIGCRMELCDPDLPYMLEPTWSVYLRSGKDGSDLSRFVRRVSFKMSPRLPLRLHVADSAPFEISEVLGSDFPVEVQVTYVDPRMSPTTYIFRPRVVREGHSGISEEVLDKMIFVNPTPTMRLSLTPVLVPVLSGPHKETESTESESLFSDSKNGERKEQNRDQVGDVARPSQLPKTLIKKRLSVGGPYTLSPK